MENDINMLLNHVKPMISGTITISNITLLITIVMEEVEKYKNYSGIQKKELAVIIINRLLDEIPNEEVKLTIKILVPNIIDTIICATKGNLDINLKSLCKCI